MSSAKPDSYWQVDELIPHRHSMQLLDQILAADDQSLWARACTTRILSSCWGIEYLGQATAAFFSLMQRGKSAAEPQPVSGMLIGSRRYQAHQPQFGANIQLLMQVSPHAKVSPLDGFSGLVKFQGNLWQLDPQALSHLPLSTTASRLPYDTDRLAELNGRLLIEGDLSVYIPPQQHSANPS